MKICLFADAQSIHIHQLSKHLAIQGHEVHIVSHKLAEMPWATVEKFQVPPPGFTNLRGWSSRRRRLLLGYFQSFDIVNVHFLADWALADCLTDRKPNQAPCIASAWGSDIVDPPGETPASFELKTERKRILRMADTITVCGPSFAQTVAEYGDLTTAEVAIVPFGVDLDLFNPPGEPRGHAERRVGFFKGFRPVYGATTLIRSIPRVLSRLPDTRFELIGDGAQLSMCRELAREIGVNHAIEWGGRIDHALLPQRIAGWNASIITSIHEAFGVAALESQAMGVPVVASAVGGLRDTVQHGQSGLLFPVGDADSLARSLLTLLEDPTRAARMGTAGREWVAGQYDWRIVARQWIELYAKARDRAVVMV